MLSTIMLSLGIGFGVLLILMGLICCFIAISEWLDKNLIDGAGRLFRLLMLFWVLLSCFVFGGINFWELKV